VGFFFGTEIVKNTSKELLDRKKCRVNTMKRLVPIIILAVFMCYLAGSRAGRLQAKSQIGTTPVSCHYPRYLPLAEPESGAARANQPLLPAYAFAAALTPCKQIFLSQPRLNSFLQRLYGRRGLGCGGLPS
jgi:hypothetical protein